MKVFKNGVGRPSKEILRKRKIFKFFIILLIMFILVLTSSILSKYIGELKGSTSKQMSYKTGQYVYYDPINNRVCNSGSYWTIYNQDTTCYRWAVIQTNQKVKKKENNKMVTYNATRLLLDHDIGIASYNEISKIIKTLNSSWKNSNILGISNLGNKMVLGLYKSDFYELNEDWNKNKPTAEPYVKSTKVNNVAFLYTNTKFYYSGRTYYNYNLSSEYNAYKYNGNISTKSHEGGYWVTNSDLNNKVFKDYNDYSYYITPSGHIGLSSKIAKRGVRPTIYLKSSVLNKKSYISTSSINLKNKVADGLNSKIVISGHNHSQSLNKSRYYYPQGFSFYGKDKFYVYMMHRSVKENNMQYNDANSPGVLLQYNEKFKLLGNYYSYHGNDIAYNAKTKAFYISTDEKNNKRISKISSGGKLENLNYNNNGFYYGAFTFDSDGKYMYGVDSYRRIIVRDAASYKVKYTFDSPIFEALQSLSYNNGYLYLTTYETLRLKGKCDSNYQIYCYNSPGTATIYVYNVKFNSDGSPTKLFGQLVKKITTNNLNNDKNASYEVESIGAYNDEIYLGFAKKLKSNNIVVPAVYKFTEDYETISYYKDNKLIAKQKVLKDSYAALDTSELSSYDFTGFKDDKNKIYSKDTIIKVSNNLKLNIVNK